MASVPVNVEYNLELKPLEDLLSGVKRPGDFFVSGRLETPMPRVEVEGVGVLSFPVLSAQIQEVIQHAERAPYGRGEETVLDTSVRKVWQLPPAKVSVGGKSWTGTMESLLTVVRTGLGCGETPITAELYKLLVYDEGGFFKTHRDAEKAAGMFGTLVIALPAAARGGELALHHAGREAIVDLSSVEVSELTFAAFYADCEHEVRPVTEGYRVCLIYNLIQQTAAPPESADKQPLIAPRYEAEVDAAATMLKEALQPGASTVKLAWLLEHQYSPSGLSFAALKNADAARAKLITKAASRAGCAVHLAIVHIEEYGSAEPQYDEYYGRRSRWQHSGGDDDDDGNDDNFEIIEVCDGAQYLDQWIGLENRAVEFGQLPLGEGELLPAGALDDEDPDEQRMTEATGNEGASFERSYHRAALVLWHRERYAEALLQAGVGSALPYLRERIENCGAASNPQARQEVIALANLIVDAWPNTRRTSASGAAPLPADRAAMLNLLIQLNDASVTARFITEIVSGRYDGSENEALVAAARLLGPDDSGKLFCRLVSENMRFGHVACVDLLGRLSVKQEGKSGSEWLLALREIATVLVAKLGEIGAKSSEQSQQQAYPDWERSRKAPPVNAVQIADLLDTLGSLDAGALRDRATDTIVATTAIFDPGKVLTGALELLHQRHNDSTRGDRSFARMWEHSANFLLARSEQPPEKPRDWRQDVTLSCSCADCREMQVFLHEGQSQTHRFRVRQDRRAHLEMKILGHKLDMTHVTERKGSPQTLVCTKTLRAYERQCQRHRADRDSMLALIRVSGAARGELAARMASAAVRNPVP
jgi:hypothetical protein